MKAFIRFRRLRRIKNEKLALVFTYIANDCLRVGMGHACDNGGKWNDKRKWYI